jgi:hypothetical protein
MLPEHLIWGIDVAIKKLRPTARFQLEGTNFTQWEDPSGSAPLTWDEVMTQIEIDRRVAEQWMLDNSANK